MIKKGGFVSLNNVMRPLRNRTKCLFRYSALDAESSYLREFWIPAFAGMT